ncbi:MAG: methylmalonyl-CoA mutase, large subunit, partial [Actinobacteria bacterium]|nr:methylmalonyl-CoA mutase, large subunit [Actinomycetota bacterium]
RQYAGFGTAAATNGRFRALLSAGQTGLSVAFDLPTQLGFDSDDPRALGEVGRVGVAVASTDDMRRLFEGIPLAEVSTSMTINATAAILLLMYRLVAEEQGADPRRLRGTVQNDILKEYSARGTYIYPPRPSLRLTTDLMAYCAAEMPAWNTISVSGYHLREAGATAVQEVAFTLANGLAYVEAALAAGLPLESFAPRLSFFWNAHSHLFEEAAKFRAARRLWARLLRERLGVEDPECLRMRFHAQTAGSTLTAAQPEVNVVRTTLQALAAVLGGTQSLHTNAYDEALGLPTAAAATLALRTQQVLAYESGVGDTVDPLAGSYFVEWLTDRIEAAARGLLAEVDAAGGAVAAVESGLVRRAVEESAYRHALQVESGEAAVVGVNRFVTDREGPAVPVSRADPAVEEEQAARLGELRHRRDAAALDAALAEVRRVAAGPGNLLYPMQAALQRGATLGEVSGALVEVFGRYRPGS